MKLSNVTLIIQVRIRWAFKKVQTLPQGTASKAPRHDNNRFCKLGLLMVKGTKMNLNCSCYDISLRSTQRLTMGKFSSDASKSGVEKKTQRINQHGSTGE